MIAASTKSAESGSTLLAKITGCEEYVTANEGWKTPSARLTRIECYYSVSVPDLENFMYLRIENPDTKLKVYCWIEFLRRIWKWLGSS